MLGGFELLLLRGAGLTLIVALLSFSIAIILGLVAALGKLSGNRLFVMICYPYTVLVRGVPDLVLMLLIFYGGQLLVNQITDTFGWAYIDINPFLSGVLALGFIFGAFFAETFRGALLAVDIGQVEAAYAYGLRRWTVLYRIVVPQMALHALPGAINNWLVLLKATALVSLIGLQDLMFVAQVASRSTHSPFIYFFSVSLVYLLFTWLSMQLFNWIGRRYHIQWQN